jgi:cellulose synthase/poly-beta-1,6-N-acetylglucosamine synthase-like glycosyltransferase
VVQENGTYVFLFIFLMVSPSLKCQFCLPFQTWMYLAVPVVFYASERSIRKIREKSYRVSIIKVEWYKFLLILVLQEDYYQYIFIIYTYIYVSHRQQFTPETCSQFTWRSHQASSTKVGCTCL